VAFNHDGHEMGNLTERFLKSDQESMFLLVFLYIDQSYLSIITVPSNGTQRAFAT